MEHSCVWKEMNQRGQNAGGCASVHVLQEQTRQGVVERADGFTAVTEVLAFSP